MIKTLLIPFFSFSITKLSLTLAATYKALNLITISLFLLIIGFNLYFLIQLIRGKSLIPKTLKSKLEG
ncbi:hypothetical protein PNC201_12685 [Pseudoalteromonas sp. NC201]|nr:hypothetical protein PNC201_12685 [Pseudoalteromonas sp. NC201]